MDVRRAAVVGHVAEFHVRVVVLVRVHAALAVALHRGRGQAAVAQVGNEGPGNQVDVGNARGQTLHVPAEGHAVGVDGRVLDVHGAAHETEPHADAGQAVGIRKEGVPEGGLELGFAAVGIPRGVGGNEKKEQDQNGNKNRKYIFIHPPEIDRTNCIRFRTASE